VRADVAAVIKSGYEKIKQKCEEVGEDVNGWRIMRSGFGDRDVYKGDWLLRAAAGDGGIYGDDAVKALYPLLATDSEGNKADSLTIYM
jgi:hypothetical protein